MSITTQNIHTSYILPWNFNYNKQNGDNRWINKSEAISKRVNEIFSENAKIIIAFAILTAPLLPITWTVGYLIARLYAKVQAKADVNEALAEKRLELLKIAKEGSKALAEPGLNDIINSALEKEKSALLDLAVKNEDNYEACMVFAKTHYEAFAKENLELFKLAKEGTPIVLPRQKNPPSVNIDDEVLSKEKQKTLISTVRDIEKIIAKKERALHKAAGIIPYISSIKSSGDIAKSIIINIALEETIFSNYFSRSHSDIITNSESLDINENGSHIENWKSLKKAYTKY